jgi:hypothetical protein
MINEANKPIIETFTFLNNELACLYILTLKIKCKANNNTNIVVVAFSSYKNENRIENIKANDNISKNWYEPLIKSSVVLIYIYL